MGNEIRASKRALKARTFIAVRTDGRFIRLIVVDGRQCLRRIAAMGQGFGSKAESSGGPPARYGWIAKARGDLGGASLKCAEGAIQRVVSRMILQHRDRWNTAVSGSLAGSLTHLLFLLALHGPRTAWFCDFRHSPGWE